MFRSTIARGSHSIGPRGTSWKWLLTPSSWAPRRYMYHQLSHRVKLQSPTLPQLRDKSNCNSSRYPILEQVRLISFSPPKFSYETRDKKREEEVRNEKLKADPDHVSSTSTVTPIFGDSRTNTPAHESNDVDMLAGLTSDLRTVRDTFRLQDVPREVLYIGMAGLVPYVTTTVSTLYLAWELKYSSLHGLGYLINKDTAESLLHVLEPLQVGYGAVILSFLGAIHWGLEFAGYGGTKSFRRYAIGLVAPALAWPTILFPFHEALLTQFIGFTGMYFFDTSATTAGLTPPWYSTYRFVLTLVVGASIVLTLIGRGKIGDEFTHVPSPTEHLGQIRTEQRRNLEREREERLTRFEVEEHQNKKQEEQKVAETTNEKAEENNTGDKSDEQESLGEQDNRGVKPSAKNESLREEKR